MPKFKAEVTKDLQKDLDAFLENLEMTKAEFLKLAIKAREYLVSNTSQIGAMGPTLLDAAQTRLAPLREEAGRRLEGLKARRSTAKAQTAGAGGSPVKAKSADAAKAAVKSGAKKARNLADDSLEKILAANQKLFDLFTEQAKSRGMSYKAYAESLGFKIQQVQRIKSEKAMSFVPKLKAAMEGGKK